MFGNCRFRGRKTATRGLRAGRAVLSLVLLPGLWAAGGPGRGPGCGLIGMLAGGVVAAAQGQEEAAIRGRVLDGRGLPVAGAEIRLRPEAEGDAAPVAAAAVGRTDRRGGFALLGLVPGTYRAELRLPGAMFSVGPVRMELNAGEVAEVDLRLRAAATGGGGGLVLVVEHEFESEFGSGFGGGGGGGTGGGSGNGGAFADAAGVVAGVAAKAPLGGKSVPGRVSGGISAAAGGGGGADALSQLPVEDRQWESVEAVSAAGHDATLAGGGSAQDATEEGSTATAREERETGSAATGLSFDGLPATQNAQTVDGLSAEQGFSNGPRGATRGGGGGLGSSFAQGAVRSVRVMPRTFSAQYGGAAGGVVTVGSRSAEGRLHGSAFAQTRQSAWAATNPFSAVSRYAGGLVTSVLAKPNEATTEYGAAVGVPVRLPGAWRAGVFGALEGQVQTQTLVSAPATSGFFAISATQKALLGNRGVGTGATGVALDYLNSLMGTTGVRAPRTLGFGRLDAAPGDRNRFNLGMQIERASGPVTGGGQIADGVFDRAVADVGSRETQVEAYTAGWQHSFGARATNSLRLQMAHDLQFETPGTPGATEPAVGPGGYAPQVAIGPDGFTYGTPASLGRVAYPDEQRMEAADSFALRIGRQVLTMGGDWSRLHDRVQAATNLEGAFNYDSGNTGGYAGGLVDWITDFTFNVHAYPNGGCPGVYAETHYFCFRSFSQGFTSGATEFVTHQASGFAEDSVRLRRDLLLTVGARYDYLLLPFPQTPNVTLDTALRQLGPTGGPAMGTTNSFPEDRNNFGPRVSFAWSPRTGRRRLFTVQAGYGMFYGRLPGATIDAALADTALPGSTTNVRITPKVETDCPQVANQGFGYPCSFLSTPAGVVGKTSSAVVFSQHFRMPAVQRGTFALEHEVGRRLLLRGEYATAWTTQLPESVDLNIAPSTANVAYVIQGGDAYADPRRGLHTGETFQVPLYTARRTAAFGPVTALVSNANATFHSGTMEARLENFHGWGLRASYTYAKAIDYGPQSSPTPRQDGQFDPFSNGYDKGLSSLNFPHHFAGDVRFRSEVREGSRMFRAAASGWQFAAIGTAGSGAPYSYVVFGGTRLTGGHESINGSGGATYLPTVGRNTLRLPMRGTANVRMGRELPLHGKLRVELRADAFNVLNSVNLSRVETRAFLLGTPAASGAPTPLIFQDAATIAAEGLTTPAFGTPLSSTSGLSRERQIEVGARLNF